MERYRISEDGVLYYITYSIVEWLPNLISDQTCDIVTDSLNFCTKEKHLCVSAYVIMPTHIHAIVFDRQFDSKRLEKTPTDFRKFTGRSLSDSCARRLPACFNDTLKAAALADRKRRLWQPSRHPVVIETEPFYLQKLNYLHENPCRKGLVARPGYWRYSSAAYYASDGREPCDVEISPVDW